MCPPSRCRQYRAGGWLVVGGFGSWALGVVGSWQLVVGSSRGAARTFAAAGQTRADSRHVVRIEHPVVMTGPEQFIVRPDLAHQACAVRGRSEQEVSQLVRDRPAEQDPVIDAEIVGQALSAIDKNRGQHTGPCL